MPEPCSNADLSLVDCPRCNSRPEPCHLCHDTGRVPSDIATDYLWDVAGDVA